jgi:hypothetical protein
VTLADFGYPVEALWFYCSQNFKLSFNNIAVISWRSVLLVEKTGVPGENHRPAASRRQTLSHNVLIKFFI